MDISPYLKLMLEKNAESLSLQVGALPQLKLNGELRPVGKTELTANMTKELAFALLDATQKQQLIQEKCLTFNFTLGDAQFSIAMSVESLGLALLIQPLASLPAEVLPQNIAVLGTVPTETLSLWPYLKAMVEIGASDLFLTVGSAIKAKVYGQVVMLDQFELTVALVQTAVFDLMTAEQIAEFQATKDLDFAIELPDGSARFRANAFYQRKCIGLVLRLIPSVIPSAAQLGLPEILLELIMQKRGLLLMVGGTGSGKSTTLAAMIHHRNANSTGHILTIEDPIEFSHPNLQCIMNQREIGVDTTSYARALKASLREAPDVILIGEIRDKETMEAALELANTGHLCISTLHANNANQAMERIVNMFPHVQHHQLFMDLAANLRAVISQRLIPDLLGKRCAAIEIMINTPHIANLILKGELHEIKSAMSSSGSKGMQIFDDALHALYQAGRISLEEALKNADSRNDLEAKINFG